MAISILWSVIGVTMMVIASRLQNRIIWLAAAGLLVAVVAKLFLVDLAATGTIARIVSFLIVGGLLILVGYLSPLPPKRSKTCSMTSTSSTMPRAPRNRAFYAIFATRSSAV